MALMILAAAAGFWYVSFQYYGARRAGEVVSAELPLRTAVMEALYPYSFQQVATHFRAPQIAFGGLAYVVLVLGFANAPLLIWLKKSVLKTERHSNVCTSLQREYCSIERTAPSSSLCAVMPTGTSPQV
ncbi:hypothetical protein [Pseudomonas anguilliseptica]|uniref:hypothetical protein n=1 Tax=Pseudomonas anguilliseptica TaxID=53406 RepID=UPI0011147AE8|nr:hypothetical protein [Pseudomonas anguilliseptica]